MVAWDAIPEPEVTIHSIVITPLASTNHILQASLVLGEPRSVKENLAPAADSNAASGNESPLSSSESPSPTLSPRLSDSRSAVSSDPNTPSVPFINLPTKHSLPDGEWLSQTLNPSHPIHRLPVELLVLMFQLGTWADPATFPTIISQGSFTMSFRIFGPRLMPELFFCETSVSGVAYPCPFHLVTLDVHQPFWLRSICQSPPLDLSRSLIVLPVNSPHLT